MKFTELEVNTTPSGRFYQSPEGVWYPSITTVLSHIGKEHIEAWRARVGEEEANKVSREATSRGTLIHSLMEKYINKEEIDTKKLMPNDKHQFLQLKKIIDERLSDVFAQEVPLYSNFLGVAGRMDLGGRFDKVRSVVDFKTSRRVKKKDDIVTYFMQEAAYSIMFEERTGIPLPNLVTIMSVDNYEPIVFKEHRDNWVKPLQDAIKEYHRLERCRVR